MKKNQAWIFYAILATLAILIVGAVIFRQWQSGQLDAENRYNGFDFYRNAESFWVTEIELRGDPYVVSFHHHPRDVEEIIVHPGVLEPIYDSPQQIFISIDPDAGSLPVLGGVEIAKLTGSRYNIFNIPTHSALSRKPNETVNIPIVSCQDATDDITVVQFVHDPEANAIVRDGNCIIMFYKTPEDSVRVADRYAYMLLRIM